MRYTYRPKGVCSSEISFEIVDGKMHDIVFVGGCNGNLKAISKILEGWNPEDVIERLEGNTCGFRSTSCADQLTRAIKEAIGK